MKIEDYENIGRDLAKAVINFIPDKTFSCLVSNLCQKISMTLSSILMNSGHLQLGSRKEAIKRQLSNIDEISDNKELLKNFVSNMNRMGDNFKTLNKQLGNSLNIINNNTNNNYNFTSGNLENKGNIDAEKIIIQRPISRNEKQDNDVKSDEELISIQEMIPKVEIDNKELLCVEDEIKSVNNTGINEKTEEDDDSADSEEENLKQIIRKKIIKKKKKKVKSLYKNTSKIKKNLNRKNKALDLNLNLN